jgi:hypothetical protein
LWIFQRFSIDRKSHRSACELEGYDAEPVFSRVHEWAGSTVILLPLCYHRNAGQTVGLQDRFKRLPTNSIAGWAV